MNECSKSNHSRYRNGDLTLLGGKRILDVGCGNDPLQLLSAEVVGYDKSLGNKDAQTLPEIADKSFDALVSYHCLEHMEDVGITLTHWARVVKRGGPLLIVVPDYTLYEHRQWPSRFNGDHKCSFTLFDDPTSHQPEGGRVHYTVRDVIQLSRDARLEVEDVRLTCDNYQWDQLFNASLDQTMHGALAQITFLFRKLK